MAKRILQRYGFMKPAIDAHTMGLTTAAGLLRDCGYEVIIADDYVARAIQEYKHGRQRKVVIDWIRSNRIERLGISYRLDSKDAVMMVGFILEECKKATLMQHQGGMLERIFFAGTAQTCAAIRKEFKDEVDVFTGGESARETLLQLGVAEEQIPVFILEGSKYDETLLRFGKEIIDAQEYTFFQPINQNSYPEFGTRNDNVIKRMISRQQNSYVPLMRAHVGPYSSAMTRKENVDECMLWAKKLASTGYLDILSIGSSQLTQSNFGEDWEDKVNGGGVPINSPEEYINIFEASRPLLVRTYGGTKYIPALAKMHEETLNICWHALSLWWFNKLDGRGPNDVYANLKEHIETIQYIAKTNKPFEANVSHHFAFRGADDVTYVVSAYLAAKLAKTLGIKVFILQNMLNTPRTTWGVQDLAKSRALLALAKSLESHDFKVLLQPRAGLDYFKPNLYEAKIQLAAVTALMDDIDPNNERSPSIIHVVSYSEASHLATPEIINESIQITQFALQEYRRRRRLGLVEDMTNHHDVTDRMNRILHDANQLIDAMEDSVANLYSVEGFYKIFAAGFLPVPYLWGETKEFAHALNWSTSPLHGGIHVIRNDGTPMPMEERIARARDNLADAEYSLKHRYGR